jgi:hypothetical protein
VDTGCTWELNRSRSYTNRSRLYSEFSKCTPTWMASSGTDFLAIPAEDAAKLVDFVDQRIAVAGLVFSRDELDAVGGADLRAESAGHALGPALLVREHAMGAAPPRRNRVRPRTSPVLFSSGYCMVTFGWSMCLNVSAMPLSAART